MLKLTRLTGQRIFIGADKEIIITVLEIKRGKVCLGFEAQEQIPINREEIYDAKLWAGGLIADNQFD